MTKLEFKQWIEKYFKELRFSKHNHEGLGDIRLTIGMQELIINKIDEIGEDNGKTFR